MRKDVRFGLTIGAILLAVLVVYVLVVPGKEPTAEQVSLETLDPNNPAPEAQADNQPSVLDTPRAPDSASAVAQDQAIISARGAVSSSPQDSTGPTVTRTPEDAMTSRGSWDAENWRNALETGVLYAGKTDAGAGSTPSGNSGNNAPPGPERLVSVQAPLPQPEARNPTTAPAGTYTVQSGDTYSIISQRFFGSSRHYSAIEAANPGINPRKLKVGQVINVPEQAGLANADNAITAASGGGPGDTNPNSAAPIVDSARQYRVRSGDNLHRIAVRLYGDANRSTEIYERNRATIGADPAKLAVGMVLELPEKPTEVVSQ